MDDIPWSTTTEYNVIPRRIRKVSHPNILGSNLDDVEIPDKYLAVPTMEELEKILEDSSKLFEEESK